MNAEERDLVKSILSGHGVEGPVRIMPELGADELVIVLPSVTGINEERLTRELQDKLHRKAWVVAESGILKGRLEDL